MKNIKIAAEIHNPEIIFKINMPTSKNKAIKNNIDKRKAITVNKIFGFI